MIKIELCTIEDIEDILSLECNHNSWNYTDYYNDINSEYSFYFKAILDNKIVGYIAYYEAFELCQLLHIIVEKNHRNLKIGKALIEHMELQVRDTCDTITLEVNVNNKVALNFYESLGYFYATTRKNYYKDGSDAYLYMKEVIRNG